MPHRMLEAKNLTIQLEGTKSLKEYGDWDQLVKMRDNFGIHFDKVKDDKKKGIRIFPLKVKDCNKLRR